MGVVGLTVEDLEDAVVASLLIPGPSSSTESRAWVAPHSRVTVTIDLGGENLIALPRRFARARSSFTESPSTQQPRPPDCRM